MTPGVYHRRGPRVPLLALTVLIVGLVGIPSVSAGSAHPLGGSRAPESVTIVPGTAAVYEGTFAARAGFDPVESSSVVDRLAAMGEQLAVVTFYPSAPSFFVPPPVGARPLTVSEIADRYGLSPVAYASAEAYFESMGLSIVHTNPTRLSVTLGGSAALLGRAFGTELAFGIYEGRSVMFPAAPPVLPPALESEVASVVGLSSGIDTFALPAGLPPVPAGAGGARPAAPDEISPSIARLIYGLSALYNVTGSPRYATGEGIALVLWGDGYDPSDIASFFANDYPAGFPRPTVQPFNLDGAPPPSSSAPNDPSNAPQELTLDLEWSGSMAPGATLSPVYVPDGPANQGYSPSVATITDAFTKAVTGIPGVSVVSMSFGTPEGASQPLQSAWATDIATAAQEGITLLAATGDLGGDLSASCSGGPSTEFPAISPGVIAVGGTNPTLARNLLGEVTGIASESAWSGSGGGFSTSTPAPSWQLVGSAAAAISSNGDRRGIPDVSAAATINYLFFKGQSGVAAGTSFATPLWAGLVSEMDALYGTPLGFLTPRLYAVGANQELGRDPVGVADISSGSTCFGSATRGWDPETGWGSPRALLLYEDLTATFVNLTLSATPSPVAPGGTVKLVAQLTNRTDGKPIAGVPVSVSLKASDGNGPCAGAWGSGDLITNSTGFVSLAATVPTCYLGGHGTATATVTSDGYYGATSTTVDVNLLGFVPALAGIQTYPENVVAFVLIMAVACLLGYAIGRPRQRAPVPSSAPRSPSSAAVAPAPASPTGTPPAASAPSPPPDTASPSNGSPSGPVSPPRTS